MHCLKDLNTTDNNYSIYVKFVYLKMNNKLKSPFATLKYTENIWYFIPVILLFFYLSFYRVASSIPLFLMSLSAFSLFIKNRRNIAVFEKEEKIFLGLTAIYFVFGLFSFLVSNDTPETINKLTLRASIFIVPLLLFYFFHYFSNAKSLLMKASITGNLISFLILLIYASTKYSILGSKAFTYVNLLGDFMISPIIYSAVININILNTFYLFKDKSHKAFFLKYLIIAVFALAVLLSSSKIGIIVMLLNFVYFFVLELRANAKRALIVLFSLSVIVFFLYKNTYLDTFTARFVSMKYYLEKRENPNLNQRFPRSVIWESAFEIANENMVLGVGVANTNSELFKKYTEKGFSKGIKSHLNAHNQFIETLLGTGIFGLAFLLFIFGFLFRTAIKNKDILFVQTLLLFIVYCSIESFFESQMGLYLFCMFVSLFLVKEKKLEKN